MSKSYRFDPDADDGFDSRESIRRQRKLVKEARRNKAREQDRMDGSDDDDSKPYNVMDTVDLSWSK